METTKPTPTPHPTTVMPALTAMMMVTGDTQSPAMMMVIGDNHPVHCSEPTWMISGLFDKL